MKFKYTLIGALLGLMLRRPLTILIGAAIGFLFDMGAFSGSAQAERPPPPPAPAPGDPYAVLGVASDASDEELEQAWRRRMSEYHPDRVANAAQEIRDIADLRAREINQAYDQIKRQRGLP
ncbi:MAG: DnaJ domain-containing protein [Arenimonas sp.]